MPDRIKLKYLCSSFSTPITQDEINDDGLYPVFGASGNIGYRNEYACEKPYLGIIKDGAGVGRINQYEAFSSLLGTMAYIVPNDNVNIGWLKYAIIGLDLGKDVSSTTIPHIYFKDYGNRLISQVSSSKQHRIADFLDRKCAEIDRVLEKTRASIEEYKKLKQSVITQAVTKGIRGEREMKDSGIEWIGEICCEYQLFKLKHLLKKPLKYGANETGVPFDEKLPRYIRITDITLDGKLKCENKISLPDLIATEYILEDNDVLFARSGATVGKAFIYKKEYGKAAFAGYLIKASTNELLCSDYLFYYTQSSIYEEWKKQIFIQATIQNIGADRFSNLIVVVPQNEQQEIVEYLDRKCAEIDTLISKKEQLITELEAYKKSLIYEYVTGKKEVQ